VDQETLGEFLMADTPGSMPINHLIGTFRQALTVLTPVADRAGLNWRDDNPHDDWELAAESLFEAFVVGPIKADPIWGDSVNPLPRYDFDVPTYAHLSWIEVLVSEPADRFAFLRLLSRDEPFDALQLVRLDPRDWSAGDRIVLPWSTDIPFRLVARTGDGRITRVDAVSPVE
jgi:hypothetical protein